MGEINESETYEAIANVLPWEIRTVLLSLRDTEQQCDWDRINKLCAEISDSVYSMLVELCLIEYKDKEHPGENIRLTSAGEHLADYCTC